MPGIYTKLLDVDKVDLVLGPYATVPAAAAMPVVMQKNKMMIILFGLGVNTEFKYDKFFAMIPSGPDPKPSFTDRLLRDRGGAESEAADRGVHRRRPGVLQERLRRRQGQRQEGRPAHGL